jgi:nucleotide sugar dehydrogenase
MFRWIFLLLVPFYLAATNVSVIGIGRLGICFALCLEKAGYHVLGVDLSSEYIEKINQKTLDSPEPWVNEYLQRSTNFRATTSLREALEFSDICFLHVPTPTTTEPEAYDHSILTQLLLDINSYKVENKHIIIGCTVFPGYIDNIAQHLLQDCINTSLSYNPEFIAQGAIINGLEYPDMVLIGEGNMEAGNVIETIYRNCCKNEPYIARMSPASAEITKLAVNCFITMKIAYANLVGDIADLTSNADKFAILNAIGRDTRIGSKYLKPGYGYGGPCFPRDNRALGNYAVRKEIAPLLFRATDTCNQEHAQFMASQLLEQDLDVYEFEDVCYKDNCSVPIIEESQKLAVALILAQHNRTVLIKDRDVVISQVHAKFGNSFSYLIKE